MTKNLKIIFFVLFVLSDFNIYGQFNTLDSLKSDIENTQDDTVLIKTAILLSVNYFDLKPDSSLFYLDLAIEKSTKNKQIEIYTANNLRKYSHLAKYQSKFILSINFLTNAISIFEKHNLTPNLIKSYTEVGVLYTRQAEYNKAIDALFIALEKTSIYDSLDLKLEVINNIGNVYYYKKEYKTAIDYYTQELELIKLNSDTINISNNSFASSYADAFNNLGACFYFQENYDKSLNNYFKSLEINKKIKDSQGIMICYSNIAEIYLIKEEFDLCFEYYNEALELAKQNDDNYFIALFNNDLATVYKTQNKIDSAIKYFNTAFEIGENIGAQRITLKSSIELSEIYKKTEQFDLAFLFLSINKQITDSLVNEKQIQQFTRLEMQYQFEQTQKLNELEAQAKLNKQKMVRNLFIFIALFVFLLAITSYISYLKKVKLNRELREKNAHINIQNEEIKSQAESLIVANNEITLQKNQIEKIHKNTQDSINYASKIQKALLPINETFSNNFTDYFIFYKPRDVVSGDFYYLKRTDNNIILAVADCTGHGVPGAFVSMLGIAFLNEITEKQQNLNAGQILDTLREYVKKSLKQTGNIDDTSDGMDIALCVFNNAKTQVQFAGANNPLFIVKNNSEFIEINPDRQPVSVFIKERAFKNNILNIEKGDKLFLFSDGYIDQFDQNANKKFMIVNFKKLIVDSSNVSMNEQLELINQTFINWKGSFKQLDDVAVIGVKI